LKAPPRRIVAPAACTAFAVSCSIVRFSTEQGPAITVSTSLPIVAFEPTRTRVLFAENSLEASL
jgi:hypothetical protein